MSTIDFIDGEEVWNVATMKLTSGATSYHVLYTYINNKERTTPITI